MIQNTSRFKQFFCGFSISLHRFSRSTFPLRWDLGCIHTSQTCRQVAHCKANHCSEKREGGRTERVHPHAVTEARLTATTSLSPCNFIAVTDVTRQTGLGREPTHFHLFLSPIHSSQCCFKELTQKIQAASW